MQLIDKLHCWKEKRSLIFLYVTSIIEHHAGIQKLKLFEQNKA